MSAVRQNAIAPAESHELPGGEAVIEALREQGVDTVFGYPGGAVLPIYDALFQRNDIRHILVRHEQGAAHAAEGYARSTGKVGVFLVTSGPGATNAVTGLADALMDSVPVVCISGQVASFLIGNDAFQECDTVGITRPCTKHNWLVREPENLVRTIHEAFYIARSGRPGPVLVDIPKDTQIARVPYVSKENITHRTYHPRLKGDAGAIEEAVVLMEGARRPVVYSGGGVINSGRKACTLLRELVRETGFPVTSTLLGLGAYPGTDPQFLGMLGMHGTYEANMAMHGADLIFCIGARFDDRITGRLDRFSPGSKRIHIDVDPSSINKNVAVDVPVVGDVAHVLEDMLARWRKRGARRQDIGAWRDRIAGWRSVECLKYRHSLTSIKPQYALERLREAIKGRDVYITTEVGQHQMWAAQYLPFDEPFRWLTSGGLGTMGYGLPSAIGVQAAHPESLVIDVSGEASFIMVMQEVATAVQYRLPVKIFILNNERLGMVRQWQQIIHGERYSHSWSEALPDFVKLAEAFGCHGIRCADPPSLDAAIAEMLDHDGPVIFDCRVEKHENCFPMIPAGKAHNEMLLNESELTGSTDKAGSVHV